MQFNWTVCLGQMHTLLYCNKSQFIFNFASVNPNIGWLLLLYWRLFLYLTRLDLLSMQPIDISILLEILRKFIKNSYSNFVDCGTLLKWFSAHCSIPFCLHWMKSLFRQSKYTYLLECISEGKFNEQRLEIENWFFLFSSMAIIGSIVFFNCLGNRFRFFLQYVSNFGNRFPPNFEHCNRIVNLIRLVEIETNEWMWKKEVLEWREDWQWAIYKVD